MFWVYLWYRKWRLCKDLLVFCYEERWSLEKNNPKEWKPKGTTSINIISHNFGLGICIPLQSLYFYTHNWAKVNSYWVGDRARLREKRCTESHSPVSRRLLVPSPQFLLYYIVCLSCSLLKKKKTKNKTGHGDRS